MREVSTIFPILLQSYSIRNQSVISNGHVSDQDYLVIAVDKNIDYWVISL